MGWWSPSIMGGDLPLDYECIFEKTFGNEENDSGYDGKTPPRRVPTAEEGTAFLHEIQSKGWGYESEVVAGQVAAFLLMQRGAPLSDEVRRVAIESIDAEVSEGCEEWKDPQERVDSLTDFRKRVEEYPAAGAQVELPHQPGLLEMFARSK